MLSKLIKSHQSFILIALIVIFGGILRFWQLGNIPAGLSNDEAGYIYNSYSIWKTGHDVTGKFLPLSINLDNSFSPVYLYLDAPIVGIFGMNPFTGRFPYALLGTFSILFLFLLTNELFNNKKIALLSALVLSISPWHIQVSRAALEGIALFFYLVAFYFFVKGVKNGKILLSLIFFLLAFYSYHGTKIFFLLSIPILIFYYRGYLIRYKKKLLIFIAGCVLIFISFLLVLKTQNVSRQAIFLWNNTEDATKQVYWERTINSAPVLIRPIFNNKVLYFLRVIRENYLEAFSTNYLFLYGETGGLGLQFGLLFRGVLYIIELPLFFIGLYMWFHKKLNKLAFMFILIAPLCTAFTIDKTYVNRSIMMLPFLEVAIGSGIYYFYQTLKTYNHLYKTMVMGLFIALYVFLFSEYLFQYYFRYSIYGAEKWFKSSKDLSLYLGKIQSNYKDIYIAYGGPMFLLQYAIYNHIEPQVIQKSWKLSQPISMKNIHIIENCSFLSNIKDPNKDLPLKTLYVTPDSCYPDATPSGRIQEDGSIRTVWKIYRR